jgi:hypothetical protein
MTVSKELSKYKFDLVGELISVLKWNKITELGTHLFVHKRIISAAKRVEYVSNRMSYIILRVHWCLVVVLNVHAPKEDKIYDMKGSFQKELEQVFHKLSTHYMKIWFGGFNAKAGLEDTFKPTSGNESIHKTSR